MADDEAEALEAAVRRAVMRLPRETLAAELRQRGCTKPTLIDASQLRNAMHMGTAQRELRRMRLAHEGDENMSETPAPVEVTVPRFLVAVWHWLGEHRMVNGGPVRRLPEDVSADEPRPLSPGEKKDAEARTECRVGNATESGMVQGKGSSLGVSLRLLFFVSLSLSLAFSFSLSLLFIYFFNSFLLSFIHF